MMRVQYSNVLHFTSQLQAKVALKLQVFARLKDGWRYGKGKAISPKAMHYASQLSWQADLAGVTAVDVFPGQNGEVELAIYRGDEDFSFRVMGDGTVEIGSESHDLPEPSAVSFVDAQICLGKIASLKSWNLFICSTSRNTINRNAVFEVWPSTSPAMGVEYLSSTEIAPKPNPTETSAPTFANFTLLSPPHIIGSLNPQVFRQVTS